MTHLGKITSARFAGKSLVALNTSVLLFASFLMTPVASAQSESPTSNQGSAESAADGSREGANRSSEQGLGQGSAESARTPGSLESELAEGSDTFDSSSNNLGSSTPNLNPDHSAPSAAELDEKISVPGVRNVPGGAIWVPNYGAGSIVRLNSQTLKEEATIPFTGDHPMVGKVTADGKRLFVGNFGPFDPTVTVVDTQANRVIKKIPTLGAPYATITMSMDQERLYVPTAGSVVHVVNTSTLQMERTIPVYLPPFIAHIEISPDEKWMYVFQAWGLVTRYSLETGLADGDVLLTIGSAPGWGALSTDGKRLYTINFINGVSLIDTDKWRVEKNIMVNPYGANPISGSLTPDESELYISNFSNDEVQILDAHTLDVKRRMKTNGAAVYSAFSADGKYMWQTTVDDGIELPIPLPIASSLMYRQKDYAYGAYLLGLNSRVTLYDTETLTPRQQYQTRGAFVAGVFPPEGPKEMPAPLPEDTSGVTVGSSDALAPVLTKDLQKFLEELARLNGLALPFPSREGANGDAVGSSTQPE
ncbi:YncE family protein [Corynebacterium suicordis]|uniref:YncE family protein n=1 Tax=Corynebacterium suicordis DSM 45110 TaxID=1121369 RepID=A0ABR9ZKF5_9CORY|nr:YncE family protein [Corynebacterium suicordis]MBF4553739.1 YncE family protein [Corynebacterium suicordis DSM 45110]MDR6277284.1 YVTN family beta-propeller protein [Corynebacterium suicordis]